MNNIVELRREIRDLKDDCDRLQNSREYFRMRLEKVEVERDEARADALDLRTELLYVQSNQGFTDLQHDYDELLLKVNTAEKIIEEALKMIGRFTGSPECLQQETALFSAIISYKNIDKNSVPATPK